MTNMVVKYLIQVSIREVHNDLIKSKNEGGLSEVWKEDKLSVSDTGLRYIIPINVKQFTSRYKYMCVCEVCIYAKLLQRSLNARINRYSINNPTYKRLVLSSNMILHPKPRDAIEKNDMSAHFTW